MSAVNKNNFYNLYQILDYRSSAHPKKTALFFGSKKITYGELKEKVDALSAGLAELGIAKEDKVCLWLYNSPEFVYSFFALIKLGATVVTINTLFKREEAHYIIEDSQAKAVICAIDKIDAAININLRVDSLEHVISVPKSFSSEVVVDFYSLFKQINQLKAVFDPDVTAEIIYTSGTTGRPKGAILTQYNLISNVLDSAAVLKVKKSDVFICILPLFHAFASTVCMLLPLFTGSSIVLMRSIRPFKRVIRAIVNRRVSVFVGVPSLFNILAGAKLPALMNLLLFLNPIRVCISGAAALPYKVWRSFEKKFHRPLLQGYGLTEASPVVSLNPLKNKKPESVGLPLNSLSARVVDKEGKVLPSQEVGELIIKGPSVMKGYYHLEEETKKTIKDGWLYTGDLAKIDEDGFIYIVGRIKEMINVRGLNVYPKEIEDLLYKYPGIKEAAVVGVKHVHKGEAPVAFIVADNVAPAAITHYLRQNLAPYKVPWRIIIKQTLPKNSTGKILKSELAAEFLKN